MRKQTQRQVPGYDNSSTPSVRRLEQSSASKRQPNSEIGKVFRRIEKILMQSPGYEPYLGLAQEGMTREIDRRRTQMLRDEAKSMADKLEVKGRYREAEMMQLASSFFDWAEVDAKRQDQRYINRRKEDRIADTEKLVVFNHSLRDLINRQGEHIFLGDMTDALMDFHPRRSQLKVGSESYKKTRQNIVSTLVGVRNELAFESVMIRFGVDFEEGTVEDDLNGVDYYINDIPVDVKNSQKAVDAAEDERMMWERRTGNRDEKIIFCPGFTGGDFGGKLALATRPDMVIECAPKVLNNMIKAGILTKKEVDDLVEEYKRNQSLGQKAYAKNR